MQPTQKRSAADLRCYQKGKNMHQLIQLFENLAERVWFRLRDSMNLGVSQGEETISDILLLDIVASGINRIHIRKTPKHLEREKGTDWEWWIGSNQIGWIRYAVQAKKIDINNRYPNLTHKHPNDGEMQIDILERYAAANQAVPIYCLYNYCDLPNLQNYWQCCNAFNEPLLGCTVTPLSTARHAIETHGGKNFCSIHLDERTLPLRCLVACPDLGTLYNNINNPMQAFNMAMQKFGQEIRIFESLPAFLTAGINDENFGQDFDDFYSPDINILPKRIMSVEISTEHNAPLEQNIGIEF